MAAPSTVFFSIAQGVYAWVASAAALSALAPFMGLFTALRRALIGSSRFDKPPGRRLGDRPLIIPGVNALGYGKSFFNKPARIG